LISTKLEKVGPINAIPMVFNRKECQLNEKCWKIIIDIRNEVCMKHQRPCEIEQSELLVPFLPLLKIFPKIIILIFNIYAPNVYMTSKIP